MKKTLLFVATLLAAGAMSASAQRSVQNRVIKVDVPFAQSLNVNKSQALAKLDINQPVLKSRAEDDDTRQYLQTFSELAGLGAAVFKIEPSNKVLTVASAFADVLCSRLAGNQVDGAYINVPAQIKSVRLVARNMRGDVIATSKKYTIEEALEASGKTMKDASITIEGGTVVGYSFVLPYEESFEVPTVGFVSSYEVEVDYSKAFPYRDQQSGQVVNCMVYFAMSPSFFSSVNLMSMDGSDYNDFSSDGAAYIIPYTSGDAKFADKDITFMYMSDGRVEAGDDMDFELAFINLGNEDVDNLGLKYRRGDGAEETFTHKARIQAQDQSGQIVNVPVPYGTVAYITGDVYDEEIPAGRFYPTVEVTTVNGAADGFNGDKGNTIQGRVISIAEPQEMKLVAEKATGTWCGWCPRGIVGMEYLEKTYGDQVIPVELHWADNFDPYTVVNADGTVSIKDQATYSETFSYLSNFIASQSGAGFPSMSLNRMMFLDPYYGTTNYTAPEEFGIKYDAEAVLNTPSEAALAVTSKQTGEKTLDVQVDARFYVAGPGEAYAIGLAIVEDGLNGAQSNSYNQITPAQYNNAYGHAASAELSEWIGGPATVSVTYNDVARKYYSLAGIEGSIEGWISGGGQVKTYKTQLELPDNLRNTENCHLIAMLYDGETGEIVQAIKSKLEGSAGTEGVNTVLRDGVEMAKISANAGVVNVEGEGTADVYTFDGKLVRSQAVNGNAAISLPAGNYVVRVKNGNEVTSKKVTL